MKTLLAVICFIFLAMAVFATPMAIGFGLYDWCIGGMDFKHALWEAFKSWALMLGVGTLVGYPCFFASALYKN